MDNPNTESLAHSFANIVGGENVLTSPHDLDRYSADALHPFRTYGAANSFDQLAQVVVRPASTGEVSKIVVLANQQKTPLIPYGGGTGVMGGTIPVQGGIIVDVSRMNRVLAVNSTDLTARVRLGWCWQTWWKPWPSTA